jgi:hypothetical protein
VSNRVVGLELNEVHILYNTLQQFSARQTLFQSERTPLIRSSCKTGSNTNENLINSATLTGYPRIYSFKEEKMRRDRRIRPYVFYFMQIMYTGIKVSRNLKPGFITECHQNRIKPHFFLENAKNNKANKK